MKNISKILFILILFFIPTIIFAHSGRTDSVGCHTCRTNCSNYGLSYGEYHCHNAKSSYQPLAPVRSHYGAGGTGYTEYWPDYEYGFSNYSNYTYSDYKFNSDCSYRSYSYLGDCYLLPDNAKKSGLTGFSCKYGYEEVGYGTSKKCLPSVDNGYYIGSTLYCNYGYQERLGNCVKQNKIYSSDYSYYSSNYSYADKKSESVSKGDYEYYYLYDRDNKDIDKRKVPRDCGNSREKGASKPYFKKSGSCHYCETGYITDTDKKSCFSMTSICTDMFGENAKVIKDGKCGCEDGYRRIDGECVER